MNLDEKTLECFVDEFIKFCKDFNLWEDTEIIYNDKYIADKNFAELFSDDVSLSEYKGYSDIQIACGIDIMDYYPTREVEDCYGDYEYEPLTAEELGNPILLIRAGYKLSDAIYEHLYNEDFCDLSKDAKNIIWERDELYRYNCMSEADWGDYQKDIPYEINQTMPLSEGNHCFYNSVEFDDYDTFIDFEDEAQTEAIEDAVSYIPYENSMLIDTLLTELFDKYGLDCDFYSTYLWTVCIKNNDEK